MPLRNLSAEAWPDRRAASKKPSGGEPPVCPKCGIPMIWYNTELKRDGRSRWVHSFSCKTCSEIVRIEEPWKARLRVVPRSN
jgi:hypothetical protein